MEHSGVDNPTMDAEAAPGGMTPARFIAKWRPVKLPERAASQEHFIDLCRLLGQPTPAEHDATGAEYTFEKGVDVTDAASRGSKGAGGYADVWWRGKFGWEYKRKDKYKDLTEAYRQLCQYREALENPPLLVVSDISRTEIHTNFTGTAKRVHVVALEQMDRPTKLDLLRRVFTDPLSFRPDLTTETITKEVADQFALLSQSLQNRGHGAHEAAHFLMKCMFCLFAEDVGLLPKDLFTRLLTQWKDEPKQLPSLLTDLFEKMRTGGAFGTERIAHFNGGLFDGTPALALTRAEIGELLLAARQDWAAVEPTIFGTLFERCLDPSKRAQIGAHYTSREDIMLVVEPVVMAPLRHEWQAIQDQCRKLLERRTTAARRREKKIHRKGERTPQWYTGQIEKALAAFLGRLASIRVLDPACGSGNFLYVAIQQLLDLEKEVITFAAQSGLGLFPTVRPTQLHGIEINPYAAELAQVVIWIGYLQWMRDNGFNVPRDPILEPLQTIECRDAILSFDDTPQTVWAVGKSPEELARGQPARWPDADFIIGNPPFLGCRLFRKFGLPDDYIGALHAAYDLPNTVDLCCYWFERARQRVDFSRKWGGKGAGLVPAGYGPAGVTAPQKVRAGLLATQGIRGGANREVVKRIKKTGDIFMAWSDRAWILDGAAVHVSIVGFDAGGDRARTLDGSRVAQINADLTAGTNLSIAVRMARNAGTAFMGNTKGGAFDITWQEAHELLRDPNPHGRANSEVLRPWVNGSDITKRRRGMWIVDFGCAPSQDASAAYQGPFRLVEERVKPTRSRNRRRAYAERWWLHVEPRPTMRESLPSHRYVATPNLTKFRLFVFLDGPTLPDHQLIVFARSDDYFFGVVHSSVHELWALRQGTQLESRPRYTPTTCFETFPLPWAPGAEPGRGDAGGGEGMAADGAAVAGGVASRAADRHGDQHGSKRRCMAANNAAMAPDEALHGRIAAAAAALNEQRERWLNPPEWIDPIARQVDAREDFSGVPEEARALIRQSAIMAEAARDKDLKKRTLTNLYNERPTWLRLAHRELDRAVLAAYAAVDPPGGWSEEWAEVWEETGAGQPLPDGHPLVRKRAEVDQKVLANLLRLNLARAAGAQ